VAVGFDIAKHTSFAVGELVICALHVIAGLTSWALLVVLLNSSSTCLELAELELSWHAIATIDLLLRLSLQPSLRDVWAVVGGRLAVDSMTGLSHGPFVVTMAADELQCELLALVFATVTWHITVRRDESDRNRHTTKEVSKALSMFW
jgi:hypothetical protein